MFNEQLNLYGLTKQEKCFVEFYQGRNKYPFKKDNFRFIILSNDQKTKITKDMVYSFFEGLLSDVLCFEFKNYLLVIYHNKYRIDFASLHFSLCEDFGLLMKLFEGFSIAITNVKDLDFILELYQKHIANQKNDYYSISNLIITVSKTAPNLLIDLKSIVLSKYLSDSQFEQMIKSMFKNNLNVSKTAIDIYMHRNTINNKLDVLARDTGIEMQKFKDAVAMFELLK